MNTIAITPELEAQCKAWAEENDSVEMRKRQMKCAAGYIRRANSAMTDDLRKAYLAKALEILESNQ
ncbi:hypothetical protein IF157_21295 [Salmonella enterica subsp. enterica serovar Typhimurium]|uniref:Uncharacterized protein n=5 Tax=root TaxID=1 RepID=A0A9E7N058_9CAUD|nr:hypothetical protein [Salmonella enterica]YP_010582204.1 hypothetical protein PF619_gp35 [Salmonella phage GRNsp27]YP_010582289.1 hypothetical protein PF620_gp56 [Salmonella phage TS6]YP_010582316.1 hypothetical protein PF621_gp18 [Salmonella phage vB_SenTO17]YP_010582432.1 hypothetical protein PF622_gp59 [Salmonella phage vB_STM-ZS]ECI4718694.1 hypothetical protein [Salmonella enterica subsp. enterica]UNY50551.1 hypothetical protein [Salmonella phage PhiSTP2]WOZ15089.1 hypothetical prote